MKNVRLRPHSVDDDKVVINVLSSLLVVIISVFTKFADCFKQNIEIIFINTLSPLTSKLPICVSQVANAAVWPFSCQTEISCNLSVEE